jgi:hypothetical protein
MVTNVTLTPVENVVVLYYQDGTSETIEPQTTKSFQLPDNGFCTISETTSAESGEYPSEIPVFAQKMVAFWRKIFQNIPQATTLED